MEPIQTALAAKGADAALEQAKGFLGKLLGPAFDEVGLILQERVRQYRLSNQLKVLEKSRRMLAEAGLNVRSVPLKTLLPLLENASLEQEEDLQFKWAALLANASADGGNKRVLPTFVDILRQLSPAEARLLDAVFNRVCSEIVRVYDSLDASSLPYVSAAGLTHDQVGQVAVDNAIVIGPWVRLRNHIDAGDRPRTQEARVRLSTALDNLRRLGLLHREPGTKYRDKYFLSTLGYEFVRACRDPHTA